MKELIEAARGYLDAGYEIIALTGKKPNSYFHEHGLAEPLVGRVETEDDVALVARVFGHATTSGIGLLIPEHVLVADIDSEASAELWMKLAGGAPETAVAKTRNGLHAWYIVNGAQRSRWLGDRTLLFRGRGSYVAAPPSRHPQGGVYTWLSPLTDGVAYLPDGVTEALAEADIMFGVERRRDDYTIKVAVHEDGVWRVVEREADPIEGLAIGMSRAQEGNRNNYLAWAAMTAAEDGVPFETAYERLMEAANEAGLTESESRTTIKAAYRRRRT